MARTKMKIVGLGNRMQGVSKKNGKPYDFQPISFVYKDQYTKEFLNMNFQNVRLRPLLCAVLSVILVTGSMILPAFAAEQNVNFSYVDSVPSATVAPALWKVAGCSESLPASSAQMVLNERVGAAVDGYISSDKKAFILNHDYLTCFFNLMTNYPPRIIFWDGSLRSLIQVERVNTSPFPLIRPA